MSTATPKQLRATTQPSSWNWVEDLSELEVAVRAAETQLAWDWRRELAALEHELESLARRYGLSQAS